MECRRLGASGLKVPVLSFGTGTFGGRGPLFGAWGNTDTREARRLVDICLDAGITMFDTADVYSGGASEEVLGEAIKGRRDQVIVSTKAGLPMGDGPGDAGSSRSRLITACEDALRRSAPTTSTCSNCTPLMPAPRSRRFCPHSTISYGQERSVTSASPTSPDGRR